MKPTYKYANRTYAVRSVKNGTVKVVEQPQVVEWLVEDADIVAHNTMSKISWVRHIKETSEGLVPSIKVCMEAWNSIQNGKEDGSILVMTTSTVEYRDRLPW